MHNDKQLLLSGQKQKQILPLKYTQNCTNRYDPTTKALCLTVIMVYC